MHITIATLNEIHGNLQLRFDKVGNQYLVGLDNSETKEYTYKVFNDIEQAIKKFNELSAIIIKGWHTEQQKRDILLQD